MEKLDFEKLTENIKSLFPPIECCFAYGSAIYP